MKLRQAKKVLKKKARGENVRGDTLIKAQKTQMVGNLS